MGCKKCVKSIDIYKNLIKIKSHEEEVTLIILNNLLSIINVIFYELR